MFGGKIFYKFAKNKSIMAKAFIGCWVSKEARIRLKMKCAENNVYQTDVLEFLILKWLDEEHIKNNSVSEKLKVSEKPNNQFKK